MRIAIIGTRGIPNNYGGFEQLAEYLSLGLKEKGHEVYVYSSNKHSYQEKMWKGIHIIHQNDPEKKIGTVGQFIYDFNCIRNSRKHNFDTILNLGYTSSSVWMHVFPKKPRLVTNMDGLEWKRSKYSKKVQKFLLYAEKLAVKMSDELIADSKAIQKYLMDKYQVPSHFVAYGADLFNSPDEQVLKEFKLDPFSFNMLIARMEPENNIEMILDGMTRSTSKAKFFVVGNIQNKFGTYLTEKYKSDDRIVFAGPIYDIAIINNLRYFCNLYFHGHSVGGTNPSLIEAMGCHALIAAHENEFNRSVLEQDAFYFSDWTDISKLLEKQHRTGDQVNSMIENNYQKIKTNYSWSHIVESYERILTCQ